MASPSALKSRRHYRPKPTATTRPQKLRSLGPYVQRSTGLSLFSPDPQPVAQLGRNPHRRSDHRRVVRPFGLPNLYAGLPSLAGVLSFRTPSPTYPHDQLVADRLLSIGTKTLQTGGCPCLLSSNLYPLPYAVRLTRDTARCRYRVAPTSLDRSFAIFACKPSDNCKLV